MSAGAFTLPSSEIGQQSAAMFISPKMLTDVSLTIMPVGDTITV